MATSIPPQKAPGWAPAPSAQDASNTNGLEIGMSGMSLVSTLSGNSRPPALSGSSVSTGDANVPLNVDNSEHFMGLTPPSPASPLEPGAGQSSGSLGSAKPPGLGMSLPSPIGIGSNTHTSSSHISLTPPSSLDGNIDFFNMGKPSSPYFEAPLPAPPNLDQSGESGRDSTRSHSSWSEAHMNKSERNGRRGSFQDKRIPQTNFDEGTSGSFGGLFSTGSFDPVEQDDGLRGLGALSTRDRSQSSPGPFSSFAAQGPGPFSSSPVLYRESSPLHGDGSVGSKEEYPGARGIPSDNRRSRTLSNGKAGSRPPLAGGATSTSFVQSQDGAGSALGNNFAGGSTPSGGQHPGYGPDGQRHHGLGSIARPELRYSVSDIPVDNTNVNRGRSMSLGASGYKEYREPPRNPRDGYSDAYQQHIEQLHAQKFGAPQPFNAHIQQQQRMPPHMNQSQQQHMQPPPSRHVRSFSQPGPVQHEGTYGHSHGHEDLMRYGAGQLQTGGEHRRNHSTGGQQRHMLEGDSTSSADGSRYGRFPYPHMSRSSSTGANLTQVGGSGLMPRGGSMSQPALSASAYEGQSHGKSSFQPHVSQKASGSVAMFPGHGIHPNQVRQQRVDHPEYQSTRGTRYEDAAVPVMAPPEELRGHGVGGHDPSALRHERLVSPSHSPLNMTVGGHSGHIRHYSDGTGMSASPISLGSTRAAPTGYGTTAEAHVGHLHGDTVAMMPDRHHQRSSSFDDDLTHPLVGEHIDDPEDEHGASMMAGDIAHHGPMPGYGESAAFQRLQKGVAHGPSMEQMPPVGVVPHYTSIESMHHHHPSASLSPGPKAVYNVKFKRTQRCFIVGSRITRDLKIGCYVKVEADRGEDLGIVVSKIPADKFSSSGRSSFRANVGGSPGELTAGSLPTAGAGIAGVADLKRIIRLATHDEVSLLAVKREEEEELLKICRGKVRQRGLPMNVVDAEYQFDRHKLTFFFEAEGRIDFRELVRDLFSMYKTRIWMQQLDKNCSSNPGVSNPGASNAGTGIVTPSGSVENAGAREEEN